MSTDPLKPSVLGGWKGLGRFWAGIGALIAVGGVTLHVLGPIDRPVERNSNKVAELLPATLPPPAEIRPAPIRAPSVPVRERPGRDTPGPVVDPDPALLVPIPNAPIGGDAGDMIPRIAPDGRKPMQVYAAGFDPDTRRARVSLILAGMGMNEADSLAAARTLPGGVTFAVSPYAANVERVLSAVRLAGYEFLVSIPMEPTEFPLTDPGPRALLTSLPPDANLERLFWTFSRMGGYVGVTNALGAMRGDRFSGMNDPMTAVLAEIGKRGLLFVDVRAGGGPNQQSWGRSVDLVIDEITTEEHIDQRLEALSRLARDRGTALGLATAPRPVTVDRIAAWANGLLNKGLALAPVSAIAVPPASKDPPK